MTVEDGSAVGELIDDFHHFCATIEHDGHRITRVAGEGLRIPWETCAGAGDPLRGLEGAPLETSIRAVARHAPSRLQCTHLYDAACIAAARAGRGAPSVVYRAIVPDRVEGRTRATLARDGREILAWDLEGYTIVAPDPFRGRALMGGGLAAWAEGAFDADTAEAVLLLNRASIFASGRGMDLDDAPRAIDVPGTSLGVCHTYSEAHGPVSYRVVGSARHIADADDARRASLKPRHDDVQYFRRSD